ncbi:MAG: hypothetical protein IPH88_17605 [Bacteroidales bacterium]|nr:hypothetical protein [Bacteroidales bacterium]
MKTIYFLLILVLAMILPVKGFSSILNVPSSYGTIQTAIDASFDGDTVLVDPGTYFEHINMNGRNIVLGSLFLTTGNSSYINNTYIDGSTTGRVITIEQGENSGCIVSGFTIQYGNSTGLPNYPYGGGILILDASPVIKNCIIQNCYSFDGGGGLAIWGSFSNALVTNCTIQNNSAESFGGGLFMADCGPDAVVANCVITGNSINCSCDWNGGGGGANLYHTAKLENCLITNNSAPNSLVGGGGIHCDWGDINSYQGIFVTGCTIANNTAFNNGGVSYVITGGEFRNCIIYGNTNGFGDISNYDGNFFTNCCSDPQPDGVGNINSNPAFINPAQGNFRLTAGSSSIDAGDSTFRTQQLDLDGNPRVYNQIDLGAYEKTPIEGVTVQVGTGTDVSDLLPIYGYFGYSYTQQIYLGSEIISNGGFAGSITKLRFFYVGGNTNYETWNNWTIFMGNTSKTEFSGSTDWVPLSGMTQVFSGIVPTPVDGTWYEITLNTPFNYTGGNLVIAVDENADNWDWSVQWGSFDAGAPRGILCYDDTNNPDPNSPPESNVELQFGIPRVQFVMTSGFGVLEGFVTEAPGCTTPIQNVIIQAGTYSDTTDASGFYQLTLPVGTYLNVTVLNGDIIQNVPSVIISQGNSLIINFCMNPYLAPPVSLAASVSGTAQNDVHLTWMEPLSVPDQWIYWGDASMVGGLGYDAPAEFEVASKWTVADLAPYIGTYLKKIRFVPSEATASYSIQVWTGSNASVLLLSQPVVDPIINNWNEINLDTPILIDGADELWFGYKVIQTIGYPAGLSSGPAIVGKGDLIRNGADWISMKTDWGFDFNWCLQGFVSESSTLSPQQMTPMVLASVTTNTVAPAEKPSILMFDQPGLPSNPVETDLPNIARQNPSRSSSTAILTGYNVYRDNVMIGSNVPGFSYDDFGLVKGHYSYTVSAQYDVGESSHAGPVAVDIYTCFPPTSLRVPLPSLTTTSAIINWTASTVSTNPQWDLEWGPEGFTPGTGTTAFINTTPSYTLTGLTAGTIYDVYVRTYCSATDASAWVKKTFRTHYFNCPGSSIAEPETCGATVNNGCEMTIPATTVINNGDTICGTSWLHRTHRDTDWYALTLTAPADVTVSLASEFTNITGVAATPCPTANFYMSYGALAGSLAINTTQLSSAGTYYIFVAPNYSEQVECDSLNRYWLTVKTNSCLTPTALNVTNITSNSAQLSWTSNAGMWNIEWGPSGFIKGNGTVVSGITSNPYTLNGLSIGNSYSFYVQSNCGSGSISAWAGPYYFNLPCPATSLPYSDDLSSHQTGIKPHCWQVTGNGSITNWIVTNTSDAGGASPEISFIPNNTYFTGRSFLVSPVFNTNGETTLTLSFNSFINLNGSVTSCELWTTSDGGGTWHSVWSQSAAGIFGPETKNLIINTADVGSSSFQFAFAVNGYSWEVTKWSLDDISLSGSAGKTLDIVLYLESLFTGSEVMNQAFDENGPHFGSGIADQVTVELHNAANYSTIEYSSGLIDLSTSGHINLTTIPSGLSGSYYITIKHRNSIETTSALPVSFSGGTIYYIFDTPSKAYGDNLVYKYGMYCIYGGDVNQDGIVDSGDMIPIDNLSSTFGTGYLPEDANGDGLIDSGDMIIVDNNSSNFIGSILP